MQNDYSRLKPYLKDYVESITAPSKGGKYVCPLCSSGTGEHRTGAFSIAPDGETWHCFSCNRGGDIIDLYMEVNQAEKLEALQALTAMYGGDPIHQQPAQHRAQMKKPEKEPEVRMDFSGKLEEWAAALPGSAGEKYLEGRGITPEIMKRFKIGYDPNMYFPATRENLPAVVFCYNRQHTYWAARAITEKVFTKPATETAGREPVFNPSAMYGKKPCFIVESQICAISIEQAGGRAVSIGGSGPHGLYQQIEAQQPTAPAFIICLDNDGKTERTAEEIGEKLTAAGLFCADGAGIVMDADCKDPNEVLQFRGPDALKEAIQEAEAQAIAAKEAAKREAQAEEARKTGPGMVDAFLEAVQTRKYEPIPIGITDIDAAIGGGLIRQQLVLLGAAPGAGKTALAQWIFEGMAERGAASCVYLNLEMSREQVIARSLARVTAKNGTPIRVTDILQGYKWTKEQRAAILEAAGEYRNAVAPRMIYNPDDVTANLDSILFYIEKEATRAEKAGQAAPIVCLDYLQIITGEPREDAATLIKRAVSSLKEYAMKHNTIVFIIIAHNRQSNRTGDASMDAGRDTSALEYSADLQMALTFTDCLKRNGGKSPDDLTDEEKHNITLKVTKGRFGGAGREVDLYFNGETMTYSQKAHEFTPVNEKMPFDNPLPRKRK